MINCLGVMISLPPEPAHFIFEAKLFIIIALEECVRLFAVKTFLFDISLSNLWYRLSVV